MISLIQHHWLNKLDAGCKFLLFVSAEIRRSASHPHFYTTATIAKMKNELCVFRKKCFIFLSGSFAFSHSEQTKTTNGFLSVTINTRDGIQKSPKNGSTLQCSPHLLTLLCQTRFS